MNIKKRMYWVLKAVAFVYCLMLIGVVLVPLG